MLMLSDLLPVNKIIFVAATGAFVREVVGTFDNHIGGAALATRGDMIVDLFVFAAPKDVPIASKRKLHGGRLRGTTVESDAGPDPDGVTVRPEILSDASSVILKSQAPRSAVTRTMAVGPVTCGARASFNLPLAVTIPRKKGVALSGG